MILCFSVTTYTHAVCVVASWRRGGVLFILKKKKKMKDFIRFMAIMMSLSFLVLEAVVTVDLIITGRMHPLVLLTMGVATVPCVLSLVTMMRK